MKLNYLLPFFIIVILLFSFGCINRSNEVNESTKSVVGVISYEYNLNGKNSTTLHLYHGEQADISVVLKNIGKHSLDSVNLKLVSCIDPVASVSEYQKLLPNQVAHFSFTIVNDLSLEGQEVKCPSVVRVFFDYVTESYSDIAIVNENYNGEQPKCITYSDSELLVVNYELPKVYRLVEDNIISGRIVIRNVGNGIVDYPTVGKSNEIEEIDIKLPRDMELINVGGYKVNAELELSGGSGGAEQSQDNNIPTARLIASEQEINITYIDEGNYRIYRILSDELSQSQRDVITKLAVGVGNTGSAYIPIKIKYTGETPEDYKIERIYVKLYYGYSYDLFKFNLILGEKY